MGEEEKEEAEKEPGGVGRTRNKMGKGGRAGYDKREDS